MRYSQASKLTAARCRLAADAATDACWRHEVAARTGTILSIFVAEKTTMQLSAVNGTSAQVRNGGPTLLSSEHGTLLNTTSVSLDGFSCAMRPASARMGRLGLRESCITFAEEREAGDAA